MIELIKEIKSDDNVEKLYKELEPTKVHEAYQKHFKLKGEELNEDTDTSNLNVEIYDGLLPQSWEHRLTEDYPDEPKDTIEDVAKLMFRYDHYIHINIT